MNCGGRLNIGIRITPLKHANTQNVLILCLYLRHSMNTAKGLLIVLSLTLHLVQAQNKPSVIFVSKHGAARSATAAAYFNKLAKEKGLNYEAYFRGTTPKDSLNSCARRGLIKDGFDVSHMLPTPVSMADVNNATKVITFDCQLPVPFHSTTLNQWDGVPLISENYDVARDQIVARVKQLIDHLPKD